MAATLKIWQEVEITYLRHPAKMIGFTTKWVKEGGMAAARYWHQNIMARHFQVGAVSRYKYQQRSFYTEKKKREEYGHQKPIVMKGEAQRDLESNMIPTGTSKHIRGRMKGPWYLGYRRPFKGRGKKYSGSTRLSPNLKAEIVAMNQKDADEMAAVARRYIYMKYATLRPRPEKHRIA